MNEFEAVIELVAWLVIGGIILLLIGGKLGLIPEALVGTYDWIRAYNNPFRFDISYPCGNIAGRSLAITNFPPDYMIETSDVHASSQIYPIEKKSTTFLTDLQNVGFDQSSTGYALGIYFPDNVAADGMCSVTAAFTFKPQQVTTTTVFVPSTTTTTLSQGIDKPTAIGLIVITIVGLLGAIVFVMKR